VLSISDNGIGFQGEKKFEESQTLGLQLVRDLVEQIDGTLELKQEKGTTFTITIPTHYSL
jgi:two-component sensor histidine kinase